MDAGIIPDEPAARPVVDRFLAREAAARAGPADDALRAELLAAFDAHDPRAARWWELVAILQG
jgi:hypothetical protein